MDSHRMGKYNAKMVQVVGGDEKGGRRGKYEEMHQHKVAYMIESSEGSAVSWTKFKSLQHG